jgi:hypothetical protein
MTPSLDQRWRLGVAVCAAVMSWAIYLYGATHSALLDRPEAARQAYLTKVIKDGAPDLAAERELAERYWQRYPDVAADGYFGRGGAIGIFGAREHFDRHGRREGRLWGP